LAIAPSVDLRLPMNIDLRLPEFPVQDLIWILKKVFFVQSTIKIPNRHEMPLHDSCYFFRTPSFSTTQR
jgi:hypothetical protein